MRRELASTQSTLASTRGRNTHILHRDISRVLDVLSLRNRCWSISKQRLETQPSRCDACCYAKFVATSHLRTQDMPIQGNLIRSRSRIDVQFYSSKTKETNNPRFIALYRCPAIYIAYLIISRFVLFPKSHDFRNAAREIQESTRELSPRP